MYPLYLDIQWILSDCRNFASALQDCSCSAHTLPSWEMQGAEQSLNFHCCHVCLWASNISWSGFVRERTTSAKWSWSLVMSTFQTVTSGAPVTLMAVCLRDQSLGTLWCQEEAALSPSLCVTTCSMQPSPASFTEWRVFAFSIRCLLLQNRNRLPCD